MYYNDNYNMLDAIKANVVELHSGETDDYLEDAELLEKIFRDIEGLRIRMADLEKEIKDYRKAAMEARMELRKLKEQTVEES